MDDDTSDMLFGAIFIIVVLSLPLTIVLSITTCIAWSRTKAWRKEKTRLQNGDSENAQAEMDKLIASNSDNESDLDPEDSDDEAELQIRAEKRQDYTLTTRQMFRKEFVKAWKGDKTGEAQQKVKEREERRKLAKAVAKELVKMDRKEERKANRVGDAESVEMEGLPSYNNAVRKQ